MQPTRVYCKSAPTHPPHRALNKTYGPTPVPCFLIFGLFEKDVDRYFKRTNDRKKEL